MTYQDNLGTIRWTSEVLGLRNVKHIGIRYLFVKEIVEHGDIQVLFTPSEENKADRFTKTLVGTSFTNHLDSMQVTATSSRGGVSEQKVEGTY